MRSPTKRGSTIKMGMALAAAMLVTGPAIAEELNLYSSRHYATDEALYDGFTEKTGIKVNRIEGKADALIERIKAEGVNSPADVLITVDAGRLWRAAEAGILAPVESEILEERIPAGFINEDKLWFGFSTRARVIYYNKEMITDPPKTYEDLADPKYKGQICIRSSSNIYNLSLLGSLIEHHGAEKAEEWAKGVVNNFARDPKGGDTDQIRAVAAGECGISVGNTYYFVRLLRSDKPEDKEVVEKVAVSWPNQESEGLAGRGVHMNVSGAGLVKTAPNKEAAIKFLEYLTSPEAQAYFAAGNNEYPVLGGAEMTEALSSLGDPKVDELNVSAYGKNQPEAVKVFDRAGWR